MNALLALLPLLGPPLLAPQDAPHAPEPPPRPDAPHAEHRADAPEAPERAAGSPVGAERRAEGGFLGVQIDDDDRPGTPVVGVVEGSGAAEAGLRAGDRVLAVDGRAVDGAGALVEAVASREAGASVELRIRRGEGEGAEERTLTARLGTRPERGPRPEGDAESAWRSLLERRMEDASRWEAEVGERMGELRARLEERRARLEDELGAFQERHGGAEAWRGRLDRLREELARTHEERLRHVQEARERLSDVEHGLRQRLDALRSGAPLGERPGMPGLRGGELRRPRPDGPGRLPQRSWAPYDPGRGAGGAFPFGGPPHGERERWGAQDRGGRDLDAMREELERLRHELDDLRARLGHGGPR